MSQSKTAIHAVRFFSLLLLSGIASVGFSPRSDAIAQRPASSLDALDPEQIPASERFDWQPQELVAILGSHRWRHWGEAICVAFRPDGELIASGGNDGFVRLWDRNGHEKVALELPSKAGMVNAVAFRPDDRVLLAGADDGLIYAWDMTGSAPMAMPPIQPAIAKAENQFALLAGASSIDAIAFSGDSRWLACCIGRQSSARVILWDVTRWPSIQQRELSQASGPFAFSADGKTLVTQESSGNIQVWDLAGEQPRIKTRGQLPQPRNQLLTMAMAPNGKSLVTCHADMNSKPFVLPGEPEGDVILWDLTVNPPKVAAVFGAFKYDPMFWMTPSAVFSPDGTQLAFATRENRVEVWDMSMDSPTKRLELPGNVTQPGTLAFAPGGQTLASVGRGVVLWDLANASPRRRTDDAYPSGSVFVGPGGQRLATVEVAAGSDGFSQHTRIWDLSRSQPEPWGEVQSGEPLGFATDDTFVTLEAKELESSASKQGSTVPADPNFSFLIGQWDVRGAVPRDLGTIPFPSSEEFGPRPWDWKQGVNTGTCSIVPGENPSGDFVLLRLMNHREAALCKFPVLRQTQLHPIAASANGIVYAAGTGEYGNRVVKVWDVSGTVATEKGSIPGAKIPTRRQGVLPNGEVFDGGPGEDRPFDVWGIGLSSDGELIALADIGGTIQIWSAAGNESKPRSTLAGHEPGRVMGVVRSLAFSPDAKRLVSVGGDRKLIVWDIDSSKAIYTTSFPDGASVTADFAPDGRHIVTSNSDGTTYILRLPPQP